MFTVYKISNTLKGEYFISYTPHTLTYVLYKKLNAFYRNKSEWQPVYRLFSENESLCYLSIDGLAHLDKEKECIEFINNYMHQNGGCINHTQNPAAFI